MIYVALFFGAWALLQGIRMTVVDYRFHRGCGTKSSWTNYLFIVTPLILIVFLLCAWWSASP